MNILADIETALVAQFPWILNGAANRNIFQSELPDNTADPVVAIYQYSGQPPIYTMGRNGKAANRRPRIQVRVRSADFDTARTRADEIWNFLGSIVETTLSGTRYNRIAAVADPFEVGPDSSERQNVIANYDVMMENL